MINFGLLPCPLCGGEPEVVRLTQGPEQQSGVIKCTDCGLTLEWETEIRVGISRSGKRTAAKAGPNVVEAWNRRRMCELCGYKVHSNAVSELPCCNDCGVFDCEHRPRLGEMVRINCPLWRAQEIEE